VIAICVLPRPAPVGRDGDATTVAAATSIALARVAILNFVISGRRLVLKLSI
jgi:hypothetical protein